MLLLVLSSQIRTWRDRYEQTLEKLKPLQEALMVGGAIDINNVRELVSRFQNLQNAERELSKLKAENSDLARQSELFKSLGLISDEKMRNVASAVKRASEIDKGPPGAAKARA